MKKAVFLSIIVPLLFAQQSDGQDLRAIIEEIRMSRLMQELDLSTEQTAALFPKLDELRKKGEKYNEEKRQVLVELKELLARDVSDAAITKALVRYETLNRERIELQIEKAREIKTILTPVQQARFLIFEDEFNREIREMIKEVKNLRDMRQ
jgi:Spy/CpxP family protein refolding chaperone